MTTAASSDALAPLGSSPHPEAVVVPVAIEKPRGPAAPRDVDVLAYTADPVRRRLDLILDSWERARRDGEILVVAGIERSPAPPGVRFVGRLAPEAYRALQRRALDDPVDGYGERAAALLEPSGRAAVAATLSERVLPRLLPGWRA